MTELDKPRFGDVWQWDEGPMYMYIVPNGHELGRGAPDLVGLTTGAVMGLFWVDATGKRLPKWSLVSKGELV